MDIILPDNCNHINLIRSLETSGTFTQNWQTLRLYLPEPHCFLDQSALVFLCAWGMKQKQENRNIIITGNPQTQNYLSRIDLYKHLEIDYRENFNRQDETGRFIPLSLVNTSEDAFNITNAICDLIIQQIDNARSLIPAFEWVVCELVDNIINHAQSDYSAVCAQYIPEKHLLNIGIYDTGIGIRNSLKESQTLESDRQALNAAIQKGVTRNPQEGQGNGLAGTLTIVKQNQGTLNLWSGSANLNHQNQRQKVLSLPSVPGTGIFLQLNTTRPVSLQNTWLADVSDSLYLNIISEQTSDRGGLNIAEECLHTGGREPASRLRRKILTILPDLETALSLDFTGVHHTSSSFLDELLGKLAEHLGEKEFPDRIKILNINLLIANMARVVIEQRLSNCEPRTANRELKPMKLQDLLQKGESAIAATSTLIGMGMLLQKLDCTGVNSLSESQLNALFSGIPQDWEFDRLEESVFDLDTIASPLARQIVDLVTQRTGGFTESTPVEPVPIPANFQKPALFAPQTASVSVETAKDFNVFDLRDRVIDSYRNYIESFLKIRDRKVKEFVQGELDKGELWRDPLIQFNPSYKRSASVQDLIQTGILHPNCQTYFPNFQFYQHQESAFRYAQQDRSYVVTTGTGSGKSLTYVVPIINDLLNNPHIRGVRAILIYPMNALINSQEQEFQKFLGENSPIKVARYTGQESNQRKTEIQKNPPHILLTNYVMLELMLSRVHERELIASPHLKFLILDELHTYRGRQGADVAIVIRKLKRRVANAKQESEDNELICIGTSATMSTKGDRESRRQTVAAVASKLFGTEIPSNRVIDETLERKITRLYPTPTELRESLTQPLPPEAERTSETFEQHPLTAWMEMNFGLIDRSKDPIGQPREQDAPTPNLKSREQIDNAREQDAPTPVNIIETPEYIRQTPISLTEGIHRLATETQHDRNICEEYLQQMFDWNTHIQGLPFRLHQFISQGGSVYATLEERSQRFLTLEGQYKTTENRLLYPLVFCRECGQDYYIVRYDSDNNTVTPLLPNTLSEDPDDEAIANGYLTLDEPDLWNENDEDRLPDTWFNTSKKYGRRVKKDYAPCIPRSLYIYPDGRIETGIISQDNPKQPVKCWFIPQPFLTCLNCGIVYTRRQSEYTKLSRLSSEGRSTATTLLCLSTVSHLKASSAIDAEAAKILSFTDNRQDASLQAGHFNDFVQTSFLRASLNQALQRHGQLTHRKLATSVVQEMNLSQSEYAQQPADYGVGQKRNQEAFEHLIEYRLYEDLRRGWRIVQPNLEQCGLLSIEYEDLDRLCQDSRPWQQYPHPILLQATPEQRFRAAKTFLDILRKDLAIDAELLQSDRIKELQREVNQALNETWKFDTYELLREAQWATWDTTNKRAKTKLTSRSQIARFLRSPKAWDWLNENLSESDYESLMDTLIQILRDSGYLKTNKNTLQLKINATLWKAQKKQTIPVDPIRSRRLQGSETNSQDINPFFQDFYESQAQRLKTMEGREHTGQVTNANRQKRETQFRAGQLSALFCSPTMELGIDISDLNVVHLRNVPPSPANYAQRSGRAGRGGQEALVLTYASYGSSHDQYFYRRQQQMVSGIVVPPKLELANPDLLQSHVYSLWLAYTGADLGDSMNQILDLEQEGYPLHEDVRANLTLGETTLQQCLQDAIAILDDTFCQNDLKRVSWYSTQWLEDTLKGALNAFDRACNRWRRLYRDANAQLEEARLTIDRSMRGGVTQEERKNAENMERDARRQRDLLVGQTSNKRSQSEFEFYPYRYLASEGFLPGFNFPRLPVRAYIPSGEKGEFISRPRTVAIRELAPNNILYYEGNKFQISRTRVSPKGVEYQQIATCSQCGYFHGGEHYHQDLCENCGSKLSDKLTRVLDMETQTTRRRERITCDEEERLKYGYHVTTHFRYDRAKQEIALVSDSPNSPSPLLRLTYGETAEVRRINRGLRRSQEVGFKLDAQTGYWGNSKNNETTENLETGIHLTITDTCNILIVEPLELPKQEAEDFVITLQYVIERAIQAVYKLEPNELASERLGEGQYLLFWEAAEGGAGVLRQILDDPQAFQDLADAALDICHFKQDKPSCIQACYECLLSYQNQFDHPRLNRHKARSFLDRLKNSTLHRQEQEISREEWYQQLLEQTDPSSDYERQVLQGIYQVGFKLPDAAQELIGDCKPDFVYHRAKLAVFCDGAVHDSDRQQERDRIQREDLTFTSGYEPFVFQYDEDLSTRLQELDALLKTRIF